MAALPFAGCAPGDGFLAALRGLRDSLDGIREGAIFNAELSEYSAVLDDTVRRCEQVSTAVRRSST